MASVRAGKGGAALGRIAVEVGEVVVGKQPVALIGQQPVDGALTQPLAQDRPRVLEPLLHLRHAQGHGEILISPFARVVDPPAITSAAS